MTLTEARETLRLICPQPLLNWREARYYGRYGEVELHLLDILCRRSADAIDIGANEGAYIHYLRRHVRRVVAYEPMPKLAETLRQKFPHGVVVEGIALSDRRGAIELRMPVVDGVAVEGCCTASAIASAVYPAYNGIEVPMDSLDNVYHGNAGFIKIDVEGHEEAVLEGATKTVDRCRPRMLVEVLERLAPGGIARVRDYFESKHYAGYFIHQGFLKPIAQFVIEEMQDPANLPDLTAALTARKRFADCIYNFIFLPSQESREVTSQLVDRLARLRRRYLSA